MHNLADGAKLNEPYKVFSDFSEWEFPGAEALGNYHYWPKWSEVFYSPPVVMVRATLVSEISKTIRDRDKCCRLTGAAAHCGCDAAHIIPREEQEWFRNNYMMSYAKGIRRGRADLTSHESNMCLLRCDIHRMFDKHYFTFVPKQNHLMLHFFDFEALEEAGRYLHNCSLDKPTDLSPEYFFARLARAIIPATAAFLVGPKVRRKRSRSPSEESNRNTRPRLNTNSTSSSGTSRHNSDIAQPAGPNGRVNETIDEARELAEDNEIAMKTLPHVFGSNLAGSGSDDNLEHPQSSKYQDPFYKARARSLYHSLSWYPGQARVERLKRSYMDANPQVSATSADCEAASLSGTQ